MNLMAHYVIGILKMTLLTNQFLVNLMLLLHLLAANIKEMLGIVFIIALWKYP